MPHHRLDDLFAARARASADRGPITSPGHVPAISLEYGLADPHSFPLDALRAGVDEVLAEDAAAALNYGPTYSGLIELLAARLAARGVPTDPSRILVGYGSSQILGLLPQILVEPGDTVVVEGPSFMGALRQFQAAGAQLVTIPVDAHGMDTAVLADTLQALYARGVRPRFIYTIPTFHNPTGVTLSLERRWQLVALAAEYGVLVVEDDAYDDLRFEGTPLPPLAALDQEGWVLRLGTFSKILAPGVRLGWASGPRAVIERLQLFKIEGSSGPFLTRVVARACADGRLDTHIARLCSIYRARRDAMLAAIAGHFPAGAQVVRPEGGFFLWAALPPAVSARQLLQASLQRGASFLPGTHCYPDGRGDHAIRLAFSFQTEPRIVEAITIIGAAMQGMVTQTPGDTTRRAP